MTPSEPQQPPQDAPEPAEPPKTLHEAILRVQGELPEVEKLGENEGYKRKGKASKYPLLDTLTKAMLPVLSKNLLTWTTLPGYREETEAPVMEYELTFVPTGESRHGEMLLLAAKDDPQGQGAALTYARRQALTAVFNVPADEDDDGQRAAQTRQASQQRQQDARNAARPMTPEELERMQEAVRVAGGDLADLTAQAGVEEGETPTIGQGRRIKELLAGGAS